MTHRTFMSHVVRRRNIRVTTRGNAVKNEQSISTPQYKPQRSPRLPRSPALLVFSVEVHEASTENFLSDASTDYPPKLTWK